MDIQRRIQRLLETDGGFAAFFCARIEEPQNRWIESGLKEDERALARAERQACIDWLNGHRL